MRNTKLPDFLDYISLSISKDGGVTYVIPTSTSMVAVAGTSASVGYGIRTLFDKDMIRDFGGSQNSLPGFGASFYINLPMI